MTTPAYNAAVRRARAREARERRERELLESNPTYRAARRIYADLPKEDPEVTYNRRETLRRAIQSTRRTK